MKTLEYVKDHFDEFEKDNFLDRRFTKRFIDFLPVSEWEKYGFRYTGEGECIPEEWTEENVLKHLKTDTMFGLEKARNERGISSELMALVVRAWCKILENGCELSDDDAGYYYINQFLTVLEHYGWQVSEREDDLDG